MDSARLAVAINGWLLLWPRAGIARYIECLSQEVRSAGGIDLSLFVGGRWFQEAPAEDDRAVAGRWARANPLLHCPWPLRRAAEGWLFSRGAARAGVRVYHEPDYLPLPFDGATVTTVHDLSHVRHPEWHPRGRVARMNRLLPAALERSAAILTVSEFSRQELIDVFGVPAGKIVVTPLAAAAGFRPARDDAARAVLRSLALEPGSYILCVGTLQPRKNLARVVSAYRELPASIRQRQPLVLAGAQGWQASQFAGALAALRSEGSLRLAGHLADRDLAALYTHAAALLFPSLYEGFGLPILEAMACGAPVITSNRTALPEVAGEAAILVDPEDVDAIAQALRRLLDDAALADTLRTRARLRAGSFSWRRCAEQTIAAYRMAAAKA